MSKHEVNIQYSPKREKVGVAGNSSTTPSISSQLGYLWAGCEHIAALSLSRIVDALCINTLSLQLNCVRSKSILILILSQITRKIRGLHSKTNGDGT